MDHINGNPLDNRRENIRITTSLINNQNARKRKDGHTSCYKGVHKVLKRWKSQIQIEGKKLSLGTHSTESEAALAYNNALDLYSSKSPKNIIK